MSFITNLIGIPLGYIMYWVFYFVKDYGVALVLFTLLTKILLYPLAVKQQKHTANMASFSPKLEKLKKKYGKDKERYNEEMMKLYNEEGVNPMAGCLPLLIQLPILFGLIDVVYRPLTHILRIKQATINTAVDIVKNNKDTFKNVINYSSLDSRPELYVMEAVKNSPDKFSSMGSGFIDQINSFHYSFLGFNVGAQPTLTSILVLIPIISCLANLALTVYSTKKSREINPSVQQMGAGMNAMLYTMPIFSAVFAFTVPAGVGIYWIFSSIFGLLQSMLLYKIYTPEKVSAMMKKKQANNKNKKPSFYQRMMEAQQAANNITSKEEKSDEEVFDIEGLSKSAQKELQRKKLAEARKRMAEKYGDTYDESMD